jgi:hypothetical protein
MRVALKLVKWILIVLLLCVAALAAINATDEAPEPEFQAFAALPKSAAPATDKNATYLFIGFFAPEGEDPYVKGVAATKIVEKLARDKPHETITQAAIAGANTLAFKGDGSVLCDFQQANCLVKARENLQAIEQLAAENEELLERYARLSHYEGATNPLPARYTNPPVVFPDRVHRLKLSLLAAAAARGSTEEVMLNLADDVATLRRMVRGPQAIAERNLKLTALTRDVRLASELLREADLSPVAVSALARILAPLAKEELDYTPAATYEGAAYLSLFDLYRDWGERGDAWYGAVTKFVWNSVYRHQATLNRAARVMRAATAVTTSPANELGERERALAEVIRVESDLNWRTLYNPVGKFLLNLNLRGFEARSPTPMYDLIGLMRLTALQEKLKRERVIDERVRTFVENAGPEFTNPYTVRPVSWNPGDRTLSFESGAGKATISVRVPLPRPDAAAEEKKKKGPPPIPEKILKQIQGGGVQQ